MQYTLESVYRLFRMLFTSSVYYIIIYGGGTTIELFLVYSTSLACTYSYTTSHDYDALKRCTLNEALDWIAGLTAAHPSSVYGTNIRGLPDISALSEVSYHGDDWLMAEHQSCGPNRSESHILLNSDTTPLMK